MLGIHHEEDEDEPAVDGREESHPDSLAAARLFRAKWYELDELDVTPYLDDEPAGEPRRQRAVWADDGLFVAGTSAQYHDDLLRALRAAFTGRFAQEAIGACVGRSPVWIREYFLSRFGIDPLIIEAPEDVESIPGPEPGKVDGTKVTIAIPEHEDDDEDPDEDDDTASVATGPRSRRGPRWKRLLVAYIRELGFEPALGDDGDAWRHPDGRSFTIQRTPFHGIERDASSKPLGHYWVGDRSLEDGFEIPADIWGALIDHSVTGWIILPEGPDQIAPYKAEEIRILAELHAASYRARKRETADHWTDDFATEADNGDRWYVPEDDANNQDEGAIRIDGEIADPLRGSASLDDEPTDQTSAEQDGQDQASLGLTANEIEVLRLVASGMTDAQVAGELDLSPRTVECHLASIYEKLSVNTRTAAAAIAYSYGII